MDTYLHLGLNIKKLQSKYIFRFKGIYMDFNFQFGYGMMKHCTSLIKDWRDGTVILSPRDLNETQLIDLSKNVRKVNGNILLDPQFYLPHADHDRLTSHFFWPQQYQTLNFFEHTNLRLFIKDIFKINEMLKSKLVILPSLMATDINDNWIDSQKCFIEAANDLKNQKMIYATLAISSDCIRKEEQIAKLITLIEDWDIDGIYLICEHPNGDYLVNDPTWLINVLDLISAIRLNGKKVILGYSSHQMLITCVCPVNAIASGTWLNVRSFPPEKFKNKTSDDIMQRATWYYCPQAYTEYKISYLDIAKRLGVLSKLSPVLASLDTSYCATLFSGIQPSASSYGESESFRHYLASLKTQVSHVTKSTYSETYDNYRNSLDNARHLLNLMHGHSIRGQDRDFLSVIDAQEAAISAHHQTRGGILSRKWSSLQN